MTLDPDPNWGLQLQWLWDGCITPESIDQQLSAFAAAGIVEVVVEPWDGIVAGTEPGVSTCTPYLSDAFLALLAHTVRSAGELGLGIWIYDGNGAGDDTDAVRAVLDRDPSCTARVVERDGDGFRIVDVPGTLDRLSARATRAVLAEQHDRVLDALGPALLPTLRGFWKDEPRLPGDVPWTAELPARFEARTGYPLDGAVLRAVFGGTAPADRRHRIDYWSTVAELFGRGHLGTVQSWCRERGLSSLVQPVPDGTELREQMHTMGSLPAVLAWADVPGCDMWPGTWTDQPGSDDAGGGALHVQATSVAHLHGRERVQAEPYGLQGWGLEVRQQKVLADRLVARGITLISPAVTHHSYGVSQATFSGDFGPRNGPMWSYLDLLQRHLGRLGALVGGRRHVAPIAVLHPQTAVWALDPATESDADVEAWYRGVVGALITTWRGFDIVDEQVLTDVATTVRDAAIERFDHRFTAIVVPDDPVLLPSTASVLDALVASGGRVVRASEIASLPQEIVIDEPVMLGDVPANECLHVRRDGEDVYLITSFPEGAHRVGETPVGRATRSWVHLVGARGVPEVWDVDAGACYRPRRWYASDDGVSVWLEIPPFGCAVVVVRVEGRDVPVEPVVGDVVATVEPPFDVTFTAASLPLPVEAPPPARLGLDDLGRRHPGFAGTATYACTVVTDGRAAVLDLGDVVEAVEVRIDGEVVVRRAWPPFTADVSALSPGAHRIEIAVTGTAANVMPAVDHDPSRRWGLFGPVTVRALAR